MRFMQHTSGTDTKYILKPEIRDDRFFYIILGFPVFMGIFGLLLSLTQEAEPQEIYILMGILITVPIIIGYFKLRKKVLVVNFNGFHYKGQHMPSLAGIRITHHFKITRQSKTLIGSETTKEETTGQDQWSLILEGSEGSEIRVVDRYASPQLGGILEMAQALGKRFHVPLIDETGVSRKVTDYAGLESKERVSWESLTEKFNQLQSRMDEYSSMAILFEMNESDFKIIEKKASGRLYTKDPKSKELKEISTSHAVMGYLFPALIVVGFGSLMIYITATNIFISSEEPFLAEIIGGTVFLLFGLFWILLGVWFINVSKFERTIIFDPTFTSVHYKGVLFSYTFPVIRNDTVQMVSVVKKGKYYHPHISGGRRSITINYPFKERYVAKKIEYWLREFYDL